MKILAIGNSFSNDATAYLYGMADAAGLEAKIVNLYIGGWDGRQPGGYLQRKRKPEDVSGSRHVLHGSFVFR